MDLHVLICFEHNCLFLGNVYLTVCYVCDTNFACTVFQEQTLCTKHHSIPQSVTS